MGINGHVVRVKRELAVGDIIKCQGRLVEIRKILFQDCYKCDYDESRSYYDIEFLDKYEGYHHWKSNLDGGEAIFRVDTSNLKYLPRYIIEDGFLIPFSNMDVNVSNEVMGMLEKGWALFRSGTGDYLMYKLKEGYFSKDLTFYELFVSKVCDKYKVSIDDVASCSVSKYYNTPLIQKIIDSLLMRGYSDEFRAVLGTKVKDVLLGFTLINSKTFSLIEVMEDGIIR